ncbi:MAG: TolC family protein [Myxococcota bacterium]
MRRDLARARAADALATLAAAEVAAARAEVERLRAATAKKAASDLQLAAAEVTLNEAEAEAGRQAATRDRWLGDALALAGYADGAGDCHLSLSPFSDGGAAADDGALEARALATHPAVDERWAAEQKVGAEWYGARAEAWPWLDFVQVGLQERASEPLDPLHVVAGIEIALPVFQWGGEAADAALAAGVAAREETRLTLESVRAEVRAAAAELRGARARAAALTTPLDAARLESLRKAVASGYGDPADLVRLERNARSAERDRIEAALAVEEATIRLEAAVGGPEAGPQGGK